MDPFDRKSGKGFQKRYTLWLQDQLSDYYFEFKPEDPSQKYELALLDEDTHVEIVNGKRQHFRRRRPREEKKKKVTCNPDFDGPEFFKTIYAKGQGPSSSWILYLTAKDLYALCRTSKRMSALLDCTDVWHSFMKRDFGSIYTRPMEQSSLKELYKYYSITKKIGTVYNTGSFWDLTVALARTIIDMTIVTNPKISNLLNLERLNNGMTNHLKLSWFKEKNQILLWFSGYDILMASKMCPSGRVVKLYKFSEENVIQNAFFLGNEYLVIQVESSEPPETQDSQTNQILQKQDINPTRNVFYFYDLKEEIEGAVLHTDKNEPITYSFWPKTKASYQNTDAEKKESSFCSNTDFNVFMGLNNEDEEQKDPKIDVKLIENNQILFFIKNKKSSFFTIFSGSDNKQLVETKIDLESPLVDMIQAKHPQEGDHTCLFAIDEKSNLYKISYAVNTLLDVLRLTPQGSVEKNQAAGNKFSREQEFQRFPNSKRNYYHGIKREQANQVEYVILFKDNEYFEFVDLRSLQVHEFHFSEHVEFDYISDWNVLEDKLYVITDEYMGIWTFSFEETFTINKLAYPIQTQWRSLNYFKQWIYVDPCFTILISSHGKAIKELDKLEILVNSTQLINAKVHSAVTFESFEFEVGKMLMSPLFGVHSTHMKIAQEDLQIKFENGKLLISSSNYSFFFDLTNCLKKDDKPEDYACSSPGWQTKSSIDLNKVLLPEANKPGQVLMPNRYQRHNNVIYERIPENKNGTKWSGKLGYVKKIKVDWSSCPKKNVLKDLMSEKQLIRRKGYKYIKTLRQYDRSEKFKVDVESDQADNPECDASDVYCDDD